jgi:cytochrome c5
MLLMTAPFLAAYQNTFDSSPQATKERLTPPNKLVIDGAAPAEDKKIAQTLEPGQAVYQKYCSICHAQGIAGAPKIGDKQAWQKRVEQGWPTLLKHAVQGYKAMPAKGHCIKCSENDIHEAIEYMLKHSGLETDS